MRASQKDAHIHYISGVCPTVRGPSRGGAVNRVDIWAQLFTIPAIDVEGNGRSGAWVMHPVNVSRRCRHVSHSTWMVTFRYYGAGSRAIIRTADGLIPGFFNNAFIDPERTPVRMIMDRREYSRGPDDRHNGIPVAGTDEQRVAFITGFRRGALSGGQQIRLTQYRWQQGSDRGGNVAIRQTGGYPPNRLAKCVKGRERRAFRR